jgi:putative nucleotidyltransferase with HDIG domain
MCAQRHRPDRARARDDRMSAADDDAPPGPGDGPARVGDEKDTAPEYTSGTASVVRYLPQVIVATLFVVLVPFGAVWVVRSEGWASSVWVVIPLAILMSLAAFMAAGAYWQRRRRAGDLMFSELLLWGWLRRLRTDRRLTRTAQRLGLSAAAAGVAAAAADGEQSTRLLEQLADALESQDTYTLGHSRRVARHAVMVARRMGLSDAEVDRVRLAAAIHDVGKLRVPRELLHKPGRLTDAEYEIVKQHAVLGAGIVDCLGDPELTAIVRHHHERLDGTGYPSGLAGDAIPLGARIVAVADTFDAIIEARPYRPAAPHKRAIDVLLEERGTQFDPEVVSAFMSRYSGRRALPLWALLGATVARAFAWTRVGGPSPRSQTAATAAAMAALAAAALAAPLSPQPTMHRRPAPAPVAIAAATIHARPRPRPRPRPARARVHVPPRPAPLPIVYVASTPAPSSTCQAYSAQDCSVLSAGTTVAGTGSGGGAGSGTSGAGVATSAAAGATGAGGGSGLPFTGLDVLAMAAFGVALAGVGLLGRRLSATD